MEDQAQEPNGRKARKQVYGQGLERFDNDEGDAPEQVEDSHAEYMARLERNWKHAAWRTEMALRSKASKQYPSRPEGTF